MENKPLNIILNILIILAILFIIGSSVYFFSLKFGHRESITEETNKQATSTEKDYLDIYRKDDLIKVSEINIDMDKRIIKVNGMARGKWFFESSFPVRLYDCSGNLIGSGLATSEADWMTDKFITFTASFKFDYPKGESLTLVLQKDNPSGLKEYADQLELPILLTKKK